MRRYVIHITLLLSIFAGTLCAADDFIVVSYNVENLFDTHHDSLKLDSAYLEGGEYRWSYTRYRRKIENISRVIANICEWSTPSLIGLCEVENEHCVRDLVFGALKSYRLRYVHYEGPDVRGVDCALLYNPDVFELIASQPIHVPLPDNERPTRDILYAKGIAKLSSQTRDTLHVFVCHLPSQRGGAAATDDKRQAARKTIQHVVDSLQQVDSTAKIIVMGDMNSQPADNIGGLHNLMTDMPDDTGSHKWHGTWTHLDQFYASQSLMPFIVTTYIYKSSEILCEDDKYGGNKPFRTYSGPVYLGGYSDHLPIVMRINNKK